jgi:integrase
LAGTEGESEQDVKFPKRLRHRGKGDVLATIYRKPGRGYCLYWRVTVLEDGERKRKNRLKGFATYSAAKQYADKLVKDLAKGSETAALSPGQASDALAALDVLRGFYEANGQQVNLRSAAAQFAEAARKLRGMTLGEAVEQYVRTVAVVKRKDLAEAVAEFIESRRPLTQAEDGKRPRLSPVYAAHVASCLEKFARMFPGHAVCDLSKDHLDTYAGQFKDLSPKSRNHNRVTVRMFLSWCVKKDYLAATHRLFEAVGLKSEDAQPEVVDHYRPGELRKLLDGAQDQMRIVIAMQALAGLRLEEALRLDWGDVFGIPGHVEIDSSKSKTRQRRLVPICPALKQWLAPHRRMKGKVVTQWDGLNSYVRAFVALREDVDVPARRNGLRHGFVTYHFAVNSNENLTAAMAGNSPGIIHSNYRGLATKAEARKWFTTKPKRIAGAANVIPFREEAAQ